MADTKRTRKSLVLTFQWSRYQTAIRQLSDSYQTAIRQLSDSYQTVIRQLSDSYQTVIRQLSDRYQTAIRQLSDSYQTAIRQLSDSYQTAIRQLSDRYQTAIRQLSDSYRQYKTFLTERLQTFTEFFFWHYSTRWTLASSKIALHCSRSYDLRLQFLTPIFVRSSSTDSSRLSLGFPTCQLPSGFRTVNFLQGPSACILNRCPIHLSLHNFITLTFPELSALNFFVVVVLFPTAKKKKTRILSPNY
jgi:gas vesicle protein